jgi:formylglycine-generating enzyme required for sulfatase activity
VVARVDAIYDDIASGRRTLDRRLARTLWMTLEHKALHMETLLYMLLQSDKTLPPAGFMPPDWATLQRDWDAADARQGGQRAREQLVSFGPARVVLGHVDDDAKDFDVKASRASSDVADLNEQLGRPEFGWDNETQRPATQCDAFAISAAPISNGQYLAFLQATRSSAVPASWVLPAGADVDEARVRTLYGAVQMSVAHLWPVQASGKELAAYCAWKGGRLPTHVELRRFLDASSGEHGGANCTDRPGANVGFRNWTPVPAQLPRTDHDGDTLPGHNGGVWEWTSSKFDGYDGFRPSALYPAYSAVRAVSACRLRLTDTFATGLLRRQAQRPARRQLGDDAEHRRPPHRRQHVSVRLPLRLCGRACRVRPGAERRRMMLCRTGRGARRALPFAGRRRFAATTSPLLYTVRTTLVCSSPSRCVSLRGNRCFRAVTHVGGIGSIARALGV